MQAAKKDRDQQRKKESNDNKPNHAHEYHIRREDRAEERRSDSKKQIYVLFALHLARFHSVPTGAGLCHNLELCYNFYKINDSQTRWHTECQVFGAFLSVGPVCFSAFILVRMLRLAPVDLPLGHQMWSKCNLLSKLPSMIDSWR